MSSDYATYETRKWAVNALLQGVSSQDVSEAVGFTQQSVNSWMRRFRAGGFDALHNQAHYKQTPAHIREMICQVRLDHPDWSLGQIARHVQPHRYPDGRMRLTQRHVGGILADAGLWPEYEERSMLEILREKGIEVRPLPDS